jgi:dienelactone hydrolase
LLWAVAALLLVATPLRAQTLAEIDTPVFRADADLTLWRFIAGAPCKAHGWSPDMSSAPAFDSSLAPLRRLLSEHVGAVPALPAGRVLDRKTLYDGPTYTIQFIELESRLKGVVQYGYLATPKGRLARKGPAVIVVHGSGTLPQQVFGWTFNQEGDLVAHRDSVPIIGLGITLVEAGYTVFAPWIDDNNLLAPYFPWLDLDMWGSTLRKKTGQGGAYTFIVAELMGVIDFLQGLESVDRRVAITGWNEDGAQIASVMGAVDPRISAVVRSPPIDWPAFRRSNIGSRIGAGFAQMDCALGDVELAAMLAPKPLLFAYSTDGNVYLAHQGYVSNGILQRIQDEYKVFGAAGSARQVISAKESKNPLGDVQVSAVRWLDTTFKHHPKDAKHTGAVPQLAVVPDYPQSLTSYISSTVSAYEATLGTCGPVRFRQNFSSPDAYHHAVVETRPFIARAAGFSLPQPGQRIDTLDRHVVLDTTHYTLEYLRLRVRSTGVEIRGLMATPKGALKPMPGVLSIDGNSALKEPFGLIIRPAPYLNGYADRLVRQGMVVFSVYMSSWFQQGASAALMGRDPTGSRTGWSFLVPYYSAAIDVLWDHPGIDRTRIASYGISYAGVASLVIGSMDDRISTVVYSNIPVDQRELFTTGAGALVPMWWIDLCSGLDIQFKMIAPRRLIWEAGEDPAFENRYWNVVQDVRDVYESLGLGDRFTFVRHGGGHETGLLPLQLFPDP